MVGDLLHVAGDGAPYIFFRVGLLIGFCLVLCLINELVLKPMGRPLPNLDSLGHSIVGASLGMLIAYRTNSSNEHYWEARSHWGIERLQRGEIDSVLDVRLEGLVGILVDNQGGCEKIRRTPLPFVYAALIKQTLLLYLASLPFVLVDKMGFLAPIVILGVSIGMLSIEETGVEIEDPFGLDLNHLALDQICATIGRDVTDLVVDSGRSHSSKSAG